MLGWNVKYPYTDLHELNLDFVLAELKALNEKIEAVLQEAIDQATANAKEYVDSQLGDIETEFAEIKRQFAQLDLHVDDLDKLVNEFEANITAQIDALKQYVDDGLEADRMQMQLLISQNNEYLLREMESYLAQIKVINYFTGEKTSIQDMFNYLAMLHLSDAIDYDTMAARAKTYTYLAGLNINYTNLALHGNTLYV